MTLRIYGSGICNRFIVVNIIPIAAPFPNIKAPSGINTIPVTYPSLLIVPKLYLNYFQNGMALPYRIVQNILFPFAHCMGDLQDKKNAVK